MYRIAPLPLYPCLKKEAITREVGKEEVGERPLGIGNWES